MTGKSHFWRLLRFELLAYGWLLLIPLSAGLPLLLPGRSAIGNYEFAAVDSLVFVVAPMMAFLVAWASHAPHALGRGQTSDYREFLLSRPIDRAQYYWVKAAVLALLIAIFVSASAPQAARDGDLVIKSQWSRHARYLTGLSGSALRIDDPRELQRDREADGYVAVFVPRGRLRALSFEVWFCLCVVALAQFTAVWSAPRRRVQWLIFAAVMLPPLLPLFGIELFDPVTHMGEAALFVFDRHPVAFWVLGLVFVAALQRLNVNRFVQTEVI
jgi:hypothetical protein